MEIYSEAACDREGWYCRPLLEDECWYRMGAKGVNYLDLMLEYLNEAPYL